MYFPFLELHGWGKRFAVRPQTIYSEVPKIFEGNNQPVLTPNSGILLSEDAPVRQTSAQLDVLF